MRNKKFQLNWYQANDTAAMERKLEKMAEKGWLLDRLTNWGFHYKRAEPGKVRYSITYFPKASVYDAGPTEEQETYADYCAAAGWEFVSSWGPLQIFRSIREDPVPIETDEEEKLQATHKSMLKTSVLCYGMLLAVWIFNLATRFSSIKRDPLSFFSSDRDMSFIFFLVFFVAYMVFFLVDYFIWYFRSKKAVERGEACLQPHTRIRYWLSMALLVVCGLMLLALFSDLSVPGSKWILAYSFGGMILIMALSQGILNWMKRQGYSRSVTRGVHIGMAVVCGIAYAAGISSLVMWLNSTDMLRDPSAEIYVDSRGYEWDIHRDELPVTLEDLGYAVTEEDRCSYTKEVEKSLLMTYTTCTQWAYGDDSELPYLRYWVAESRWDWLREYCLERWMSKQSVPGLGIHTPSYELVDDPRWNADQVYVHDEGADPNVTKVLLTCDERLVYVQFDEPLTDEQIAVIVEKLELA